MFMKKHVLLFPTGLYVARKWRHVIPTIKCHVILSHDRERMNKWIFDVKGQKFLFYVNVPDK